MNFIRCGKGWINPNHVVSVADGRSSDLKMLTLADGSTRQVYEQHLHEALADFVPVEGYSLLHNPTIRDGVIEEIPIIGLYIARTEERSMENRSLVATLYADGRMCSFDGDYYSLRLPDGRVHNFVCGLVTYAEWLKVFCRAPSLDEEIPEHLGSAEERGVRKTPEVKTRKGK